MSTNSSSDKKVLAVKAIIRFILSVLILGCFLFIPAGTFKYLNGWIFLGVIFIPMIFTLIILLIKDPELLEKRFKTKEKEKEQKLIQKLGIIPIAIGFLLPGFDFRYNWSNVPLWLVILAAVILVVGYILFTIVMRQNSYASRVIEIQQGQKVIDNGLYSVIRHPMYLAGNIIILASPFVLGSYFALIPMVFYPVLIIFRIKNEEQVLRKELNGYEEYLKKVKYKLIPLIW
jgi:protein-S-isoprenylcysteine O-methyltransferase Ste14